MKGFGILMITACLFTVVACSKEDATSLNEPEAMTRNAGIGDSSETDSGKVRIGDVVIDTTWNGETHINF